MIILDQDKTHLIDINLAHDSIYVIQHVTRYDDEGDWCIKTFYNGCDTFLGVYSSYDRAIWVMEYIAMCIEENRNVIFIPQDEKLDEIEELN